MTPEEEQTIEGLLKGQEAKIAALNAENKTLKRIVDLGHFSAKFPTQESREAELWKYGVEDGPLPVLLAMIDEALSLCHQELVDASQSDAQLRHASGGKFYLEILKASLIATATAERKA